MSHRNWPTKSGTFGLWKVPHSRKTKHTNFRFCGLIYRKAIQVGPQWTQWTTNFTFVYQYKKHPIPVGMVRAILLLWSLWEIGQSGLSPWGSCSFCLLVWLLSHIFLLMITSACIKRTIAVQSSGNSHYYIFILTGKTKPVEEEIKESDAEKKRKLKVRCMPFIFSNQWVFFS